MSFSYNKSKKSRRKSKPKHGHQLGKGDHRPRWKTKVAVRLGWARVG